MSCREEAAKKFVEYMGGAVRFFKRPKADFDEGTTVVGFAQVVSKVVFAVRLSRMRNL